MSDHGALAAKEPDDEAITETRNNPADASMAKVIYILYLVSILTGVTSIVGVILAYVNKAGAPPWVQSHYQYQIRTFWIGCLYSLIGTITLFVLVGWLILLATLVWLVMRCVAGMTQAEKGQPVNNVKTWMFP